VIGRRFCIHPCLFAISLSQIPAPPHAGIALPLTATYSPQQSGPVLKAVVPPTIIEKSPQEIIQDFPQLEGFEPAADQSELPMILKKAGDNVNVYFHNFVNISAQEEVVQERLQPDGKVDESHKQKFRYLLVRSARKIDFDLNEYRMDKKGRPAEQKVLRGGTLTKGFASMPALLYPDLQAGSRFALLGRQDIEGRNFFVVAFAQVPTLSDFKEKIVDDLGAHTLFLQGLVWIDSTNFQIIRMSTQLLPDPSPKPLLQQTTVITFEQVHFEGISTPYWLPQEVVVVTDRTDGRLRNLHRYSDYKLYASQTKIIYQPE